MLVRSMVWRATSMYDGLPILLHFSMFHTFKGSIGTNKQRIKRMSRTATIGCLGLLATFILSSHSYSQLIIVQGIDLIDNHPEEELPIIRPEPGKPEPEKDPWLRGEAYLGVRVTTFNDNKRYRERRIPLRGALVTNVDPGSPAHLADIYPGAVIVGMEYIGDALSEDVVHVLNSNDLVKLVRRVRPGESVEIWYYEGDLLYRKVMRLVPRTGWFDKQPRDYEWPDL